MDNCDKGKKIGILTMYYNSANYGGLLQAYALVKYLNNRGYDAKQISYDFSKMTININATDKQVQRKTIIKIKKSIKKYLTNCNNALHGLTEYRSIRQEMCKDFRESIPHTKNVYDINTLKDVVNDFDVFITGSDQVWNPNGYRPGFFLTFVDGKEKMKIAYAASISNTISANALSTYKEALKDFTRISVREEADVDVIKNITNKAVLWALDPVFLLNQDEWTSVASDIKELIDEPYLFCYFLGESIKQRIMVKEYAESKGLKIVTIPFLQGDYRECDRNFGDYQFKKISPNQFLGLIRGAECIFTDSFHATAFSLVFHRPFIVFERYGHPEMIERIKSVTRLFGSESHLIAKENMSVEFLKGIILDNRIKYDSDEFIKLLTESEKILDI